MVFEPASALASPESRRDRTALIEAAAGLMRHAGGPPEIVLDLFGRVPPEDLALYPAAALADLATAAYRHLAMPRPAGAPCGLHVHDMTVPRDGRLRDLTIVEAINDNRPFLLDSMLAALGERGLTPLLVAHPILGVERGPDGALVRVVGETTADGTPALGRESLIHIHLDRLDDADARRALATGLAGVFADVARVTDDRAAMVDRLEALETAYAGIAVPLPLDEIAEVRSFLAWLGQGHFTLLGLCEQAIDAGGVSLAGAALGFLAIPDQGRLPSDPPSAIVAFLDGPDAIAVSKANIRATVHRAAYCDDVAVKLFSADGRLTGLLRLVGLFTAAVYNSPAHTIPYVRRKERPSRRARDSTRRATPVAA